MDEQRIYIYQLRRPPKKLYTRCFDSVRRAQLDRLVRQGDFVFVGLPNGLIFLWRQWQHPVFLTLDDLLRTYKVVSFL